MLHGSWFLPQLYYATSVDGKNRGEAKAYKCYLLNKKSSTFKKRETSISYGGEGGIRTHGPVTVTRFRVVRLQPDSATSPQQP